VGRGRLRRDPRPEHERDRPDIRARPVEPRRGRDPRGVRGGPTAIDREAAVHAAALDAATALDAQIGDLPDAVDRLRERADRLEADLQAATADLLAARLREFPVNNVDADGDDGATWAVGTVDDADPNDLREPAQRVLAGGGRPDAIAAVGTGDSPFVVAAVAEEAVGGEMTTTHPMPAQSWTPSPTSSAAEAAAARRSHRAAAGSTPTRTPSSRGSATDDRQARSRCARRGARGDRRRRCRVDMGPAYGEDAAAIDLAGTESTLVVAADPLSLAADAVGELAVHVACNDVAASGADPRWLTHTLFLPDDDATRRRTVTQQVDATARDLGVAIVGGHTEVLPSLERPLCSMTALGTTDRFVSSGGAEPGDRLLLTRGRRHRGDRDPRDRLPRGAPKRACRPRRSTRPRASSTK